MKKISFYQTQVNIFELLLLGFRNYFVAGIKIKFVPNPNFIICSVL